MLSVVDAIARVTDGFSLIGSEQVGLSDALGRVLAEDLKSRRDQPPVAVSSMDGYAVRTEDIANVPAYLMQVGVSRAGDGYNGIVGIGECVRIFTGAPVPEGADAVVIQEVTSTDGSRIVINESAFKDANIRLAGIDFSFGKILLRAGKILSARDIGLAASMNIPWLLVRRRPQISFVATGDEIVMPGDPLAEDQIVSSNSFALGALVRVLGGVPIDLGIARDTEDSLRSIISGASGADALVTIGGASVGEYDLVRRVMAAEGLKLNFYKVAMRPGKPLIFGEWNKIPVLGLPGNPVSAGVTSVIFLRAAMEVMLGTGDGNIVTEQVRLGSDLPENGKREDFMRGTLSQDASGQLYATPFALQDSAMMALFAESNCLLIRAPYAPAAKTGDPVLIIRLDLGNLRF